MALLRAGIMVSVQNKPRVGILSANRLVRETLANMMAKHALGGSVPVPDVAGLPGNLDIVLVDAYNTGHATLTQLAKQLTRTSIIIMNADWQELNLVECARFGATGFIVTDAPAPLFVATILAVHDGLKVIPPAILDKLLSQLYREREQDHTLIPSDVALTVKEQQIMRFLLD